MLRKFIHALFWPIRVMLTDRGLIRLKFRYKFGKSLNLESPKTFNEKIQWIKLYDRNPLMTLYADKYEVRKVVENKIGQHILNELYGVFESVDEIDFDSFPKSFVLKASHGCEWNIIVKDKSALDRKKAKKKMRRWLATNYYTRKREWAYKHIKPRIVCEKYMENKDRSLIDYKFFCFNGTPRFIQVDLDRYTGHKRAFYTIHWQKLDLFMEKRCGGHYKEELGRPKSLTDMIEIARTLSEGFAFTRIDMYDVDGKAVFGEVTFYPGNGMKRFSPNGWDEKLGNYLELP
ncbi:MAG: ATP-grasp fold amidoligase family protein [Candidatus Dadabacteria bacterium]|nr:ATP-grasp fold amidoligase family protein [Candidatus Dadabacteria bacterium]